MTYVECTAQHYTQSRKRYSPFIFIFVYLLQYHIIIGHHEMRKNKYV